jgi:hypothetical protein
MAGEYFSPLLLSADSGPRPESARRDGLQYGAVKVRCAAYPEVATLRRAATYGADVLRRRGDSLRDPSVLRTERLGDNSHLVLLVRDPRTGKTTWLGVRTRGDGRLDVISEPTDPPEGAAGVPLGSPALPSGTLAPPAAVGVEPIDSHPLLVGGANGSRLVEVWVVQKRRTEGRFAATLSSPSRTLFDVQYLFLPAQ